MLVVSSFKSIRFARRRRELGEDAAFQAIHGALTDLAPQVLVGLHGIEDGLQLVEIADGVPLLYFAGGDVDDYVSGLQPDESVLLRRWGRSFSDLLGDRSFLGDAAHVLFLDGLRGLRPSH